MFVTSATDGMDKEWLSRQPEAGGIFKVNDTISFCFRRPFFYSWFVQVENQLGVVGSWKKTVVRTLVIYIKLLFVIFIPVAEG